VSLSCPRCVVAAAGFSPATTASGPGRAAFASHTLRALPKPGRKKVPSIPETIKLDPSRVPERFRKWIPLAPRWGGKLDDDIVGEIVDDATREELDELLALLDADEAFWKELYAWLGGPESESKPLTNEYCAFHCLGVALDYAKLRRKREDHPEAFRTPSVHSSPVHRSIRSSANSTRIGRASGQYATPSSMRPKHFNRWVTVAIPSKPLARSSFLRAGAW